MKQAKRLIRELAEKLVQVTSEPDSEPGGKDWWIGLDVGTTRFWDTSCVNKRNAMGVARECRKGLAKHIEAIVIPIIQQLRCAEKSLASRTAEVARLRGALQKMPKNHQVGCSAPSIRDW
jgi:hypothetical protein